MQGVGRIGILIYSLTWLAVSDGRRITGYQTRNARESHMRTNNVGNIRFGVFFFSVCWHQKHCGKQAVLHDPIAAPSERVKKFAHGTEAVTKSGRVLISIGRQTAHVAGRLISTAFSIINLLCVYPSNNA